ncbi:Nucleolar pre-ribosomal-associated protein 1 [Galemys pyrenaicus]|uniref:Nucleolar pre-ribosomal-associated protein 1 n=1 Tax=Galemys pyrenaicus TaxID=202257 RepID=A0A8J6ABG1_GALPY|nr:Nucleolar pre-ribosomal-associated protein 1 [Galemys pyrenaicus]
MGVPKRKARSSLDGAAAPGGAVKRARKEELTGASFKAQLRDPQGAERGECGLGRGGVDVRARRLWGLRGPRGLLRDRTRPLLALNGLREAPDLFSSDSSGDRKLALPGQRP